MLDEEVKQLDFSSYTNALTKPLNTYLTYR
jgi:hypothetical protein